MVFKPNPPKEQIADSPEQLLQMLPRGKRAATSLWSHQADVLRDYMARFQKSGDVAIELPTGTGKTLPGLLIAEWRRRKNRGRVVYACPTVQLVRQVVRVAERQSVPVVDLSGSSKYWSSSDKAAFEGGRAIAVATYNAIFNVNPRLRDIDLLIFDDAHAGEQYVASAYTVEISRRNDPAVYEDVIEAIRPALSKERHHELTMTTPGVAGRRALDVVFPALYDSQIPSLDHALSKLASGSREAFHYSAIAGHLTACAVYLSWDTISIRPLTPPTFENVSFSNAKQRLYLSATLGASGELERAFGRPTIKRLALPENAGRPTSGRRFIVFPFLASGIDSLELTKQIVEVAGKAIVISPSDYKLRDADQFVPSGWPRFERDDIVDSFDGFAHADHAVCLLANRYDGIDLPGDACHCVVLFGHPDATHLQERFLAERARSSAAIEERVRSRVIQGTGRCTRHTDDWALVVVADPDMTSYLSRTSVQETLDEDLQAEVRFGLEQSETTTDEFLENIAAFLAQGEAWAAAESLLSEYRGDAHRQQPADCEALANAASSEVRALEAAWASDFHSASDLMFQAAEALVTAPTARGYRSTALFLAAVYANYAGRVRQDPALLKSASGLADKAVAIAAPATWMRALLPFPQEPERGRSGADQVAVQKIAQIVTSMTTAKLNGRLAGLHEGLASISHKTFEPALSVLGELLGAESWKPKGDGRADSVWCWANDLWLTLEAKSEHQTGGQIGIEDVRNNNHHLELLAKDRAADIPEGSASILISPLVVVKADGQAIAAESTFLVDPGALSELADSVERFWKRVITLRNVTSAPDREQGVSDALRDFRLFPSDVADRLTVRAVDE